MTSTPTPPDRAQSNESVPQSDADRWKLAYEGALDEVSQLRKFIAGLPEGTESAAQPVSQRATGEELRDIPETVLSGAHSLACWMEMNGCTHIGPIALRNATPHSLPHGPAGDENVIRALVIANRLAGRQLVVDVEREVHLIINALNAAKP